MDRIELQRLRDLPIEGVAERLGLSVQRHRSLCPFHADSHPSLMFNVGRNTCRCFVCMSDSSLGTIDLVMRFLHKDFREACRWLADANGVILDTYRPQPKPAATATPRPFDASRYARFFEHPCLSPRALRFLHEERHIDPRVVRWCRLASWTDREGTEWLQIPYFDTSGRLVGVQNRNLEYGRDKGLDKADIGQSGLDGLDKGLDKADIGQSGLDGLDKGLDKADIGQSGLDGLDKGLDKGLAKTLPPQKPRFKFPRGSKCSIYNLPVLPMLARGEELYITEGASDCWAMLSAGHKAVAIPSATLLTPDDAALLRSLSREREVSFHMYPDRDAPGERLFMQLHEVLPNLQHHQLPMGVKDFGEWYARETNNHS